MRVELTTADVPGQCSTKLSYCGVGVLGGIRTPDRLIRSQVLYPLSYQNITYSVSDVSSSSSSASESAYLITSGSGGDGA